MVHDEHQNFELLWGEFESYSIYRRGSMGDIKLEITRLDHLS